MRAHSIQPPSHQVTKKKSLPDKTNPTVLLFLFVSLCLCGSPLLPARTTNQIQRNEPTDISPKTATTHSLPITNTQSPINHPRNNEPTEPTQLNSRPCFVPYPPRARTSFALLQEIDVSKPFKIGFIGTGGIAIQQMKFLKQIPGVEIVAGADISEKSLECAKTEMGVQQLFTDYKKMLKEVPDLDAVSVCTPNGLHMENTVAALGAGKNVLVEKPMAMNAKEGQKMIDAANKAGKKLVIGFQWRFDARSELIREHVAAGRFGKILYVRAQALRRRGIPNWGVFGRKELQGGGPMIDIGVHILELAHSMIGSPNPVSATGHTWTYHGHKASTVRSVWPNWDYKTYTVEDLAVGMIRFDTGTMLTIESSFVAHIEKDIFNVEIMGETGGANWEMSQLFMDQNNYMMNIKPAYIPTGDIFERKMKHFVEVCRDGRKNEAPAEHGLAVQKMLDSIYASSEAGKEVVIK
jgi:predicted dehydrogenase